jgi:hypothetical protein
MDGIEYLDYDLMINMTWYFIENQEDAPDKLKDECKMIYGILNMDISEE